MTKGLGIGVHIMWDPEGKSKTGSSQRQYISKDNIPSDLLSALTLPPKFLEPSQIMLPPCY